jgi:hypothetical protein
MSKIAKAIVASSVVLSISIIVGLMASWMIGVAAAALVLVILFVFTSRGHGRLPGAIPVSDLQLLIRRAELSVREHDQALADLLKSLNERFRYSLPHESKLPQLDIYVNLCDTAKRIHDLAKQDGNKKAIVENISKSDLMIEELNTVTTK